MTTEDTAHRLAAIRRGLVGWQADTPRNETGSAVMWRGWLTRSTG